MHTYTCIHTHRSAQTYTQIIIIISFCTTQRNKAMGTKLYSNAQNTCKRKDFIWRVMQAQTHKLIMYRISVLWHGSSSPVMIIPFENNIKKRTFLRIYFRIYSVGCFYDASGAYSDTTSNSLILRFILCHYCHL